MSCMSPSNFQLLSPLMLWIPLGSSSKGVDDAGSDHRSEGLCMLDHIMHQNIGCCFCLQLISICSCLIQAFLNRFETSHGSLHFTTLWPFQGNVQLWVAWTMSFQMLMLVGCPQDSLQLFHWQGRFIAFDLLFLTVFCSIWVIKITLANLILPRE